VPPKGGRKHPHQQFIQIDTTNILFVFGGSFDGIEKIINSRVTEKVMGFGADIKSKEEKQNIGEVLKHILPQDLLHYGLIPEFIGRMPVIATLNELSVEDLIQILTEPKNALTKQYKKFFQMDDVELEFTEGALKAIAEKTLEVNTGARGLRSVVEDTILEIMYDLPSQNDIKKCIIDEGVINKSKDPELIREEKITDDREESA
jgi:ATP-dependent Clp protease ATP-binding subunit ClpX